MTAPRPKATRSHGPTLAIDWTRCDGHGLCAAVLPDSVSLDDWGYPILGPKVRTEPRAALKRAVAVCPALALRLE
jgi:ferredoxin